jgi:hypothetical protein
VLDDLICELPPMAVHVMQRARFQGLVRGRFIEEFSYDESSAQLGEPSHSSPEIRLNPPNRELRCRLHTDIDTYGDISRRSPARLVGQG